MTRTYAHACFLKRGGSIGDNISLVLLSGVILLASHPARAQSLTLEDKLLASDGQTGDYFGYAVDLSGPVGVVGASSGRNGSGVQSGAAYVFVPAQQGWVQDGKLAPSDGVLYDRFGQSVGVSGKTIAVGAPQDDDKGGDSGSVYVFTDNGSSWPQTQKLLASDGAAYDHFGISLAIDGDVLVVGAPDNLNFMGSNGRGAAYVFRLVSGRWVQSQKLLASDAAAADAFATSVAISGNWILVGTPNDDDRGSQSGSVYAFQNVSGTWVQRAKLLASDGTSNEYFGTSVAIDGSVAVAGKPRGANNGVFGGAAYIFRLGGSSWVQEAKLWTTDSADYDQFGYAVSIQSGTDGETAIIGAPENGNYGGAFGHGAAYVFHASGSKWTQDSKLQPADVVAGEHFGFSAALTQGTALLGAYTDSDRGGNSGSAYVYGSSDTTPPIAAPVIKAAVSRAYHGAKGYFDIDLLGPTTAIEMRRCDKQIVVTFDQSVEAVDGALDTEIVVNVGTISRLTVAGDELTIDLTNVPDRSCLKIEISGLRTVGGTTPMAYARLPMVILSGDVNMDGAVNVLDLSEMKLTALAGVPTDATNYELDINCDGVIDVMDLSLAKTPALNGIASPSCP